MHTRCTHVGGKGEGGRVGGREGGEQWKREEAARRKMEERAIMRAPSIRNYADVAPHRNR